ncbi:MAG: substrate-binding domain-containing protein [Candidatus Omnitrophota bacterium]
MELLLETNKFPRWEEICNDLITQIPGFEFGQRFYTLSEICAKYKVSNITARRVLNELHHNGLVKKVQKRGTVVNVSTQPLKIRLVIPDKISTEKFLASHVASKIVRNLSLEAKKLRVDFDITSERFLTLLSPKNNHQVGILILRNPAAYNLSLIKENNLAFVVLHPAREEKEVVQVRVDKKTGGYLGTRYLITMGHRRIGLICGPVTSAWFVSIFEGYQQALRESKINLDQSLAKETSGFNPKEDETALEQLLALPRPPSAVFTANDHRALHLLDCCHKNNIKVPEDLSIVGYDNISETLFSDPPLTTVEPHLDKVSVAGLHLLLKMMGGAKKSPRQIVVKPELVVRNSVKIYP